MARLNNALSFFSVMIIIFFDFFFIIPNEKKLDNVSTVFPDFEIIMKSTLSNFSFFLKSIIWFMFKLLKK